MASEEGDSVEKLEKCARLRRRQVARLRDSINKYLISNSVPSAEHIYRIEREANELKEARKAFESIYEDRRR